MVQFLAALSMAVAVGSSAANSAENSSSADKLRWISDYGQALEATKRDERPLLVVLEAPQEAKKSLGAEVTDASESVLAKYDLCRVDASTEYGKKVVKAFGAKQLPHVAIIDKSGSVVLHKHAGPVSPTEFKSTLEQHKLGQRPAPVVQTSYFRGQMGVSSPGYCPSCQRAAMQMQ